MEIGNTHIDGSILVALVLVAGGLLGIYMLYHRPEQPIEHPAARIVRLVRGTRFGIQPDTLYFVEHGNDEVHIASKMSFARRTYHARGWALRISGGKIQVAEVHKDEDLQKMHSRRFVDYDG